jgi:hypothetical protein
MKTLVDFGSGMVDQKLSIAQASLILPHGLGRTGGVKEEQQTSE